jgi:hypothetical protein
MAEAHAGEKTYTVEKIIGHRIRDGQDFYHVKWLGYNDPKDLTWEPVEHLENVRSLISDFWKLNQTRVRSADSSSSPHTDPSHHTSAIQFERPPAPRDFRSDIGVSADDDIPASAVPDRADALAPWPAPEDPDADLEPTTFWMLQRPGIVYVRDDRREAAHSWFFDIREFATSTDCKFEDFHIVKLKRTHADVVVVLKYIKGNVEEVDYDAFAAIFPDALLAFVEQNIFLNPPRGASS